MAYHRDQRSIRESYDECFIQSDSREVTFQRVVNIVERRPTMSRVEVEPDQGNFAPEWQENRFNDEDNGSFSFQRNSTPPQEDNAYYGGEREDTRQVEISQPWDRKKARGRPYQEGGSRKPPLPQLTGRRGYVFFKESFIVTLAFSHQYLSDFDGQLVFILTMLCYSIFMKAIV